MDLETLKNMKSESKNFEYDEQVLALVGIQINSITGELEVLLYIYAYFLILLKSNLSKSRK